MDGMRGFTRSHGVALAVAGSLLMFLGWIVAIVPTFHDLRSVWPVVVIALIAFGVVLIPPGLDVFWRPGEPGQKTGLFPVLIAALPAALLFIVAVGVLPLSTGLQVLAIALELGGIVVYLGAWWSIRHVANNS